MKYLPKNIEVKFLEDEKTKAIINLVFEDFVVKGFRIMVSEFENANGDKLWVVPPSYAGGNGSYHPIFFMPNKQKWQEVENLIFQEYKKQTNS